MATIKQNVGSAKSVKQTITGSTSGISQDLNKEGYTSSITENPTVVDQNLNNGGVTSDNVSRSQWGSITGNIQNQTDLIELLNKQKESIEVPTKISELENDSGFVDQAYAKELVSSFEACKVISIGTTEFMKLNPKDMGTVYIVFNSQGTIYRVYIGTVLIFSENVLDNQGFPYTFPIIL